MPRSALSPFGATPTRLIIVVVAAMIALGATCVVGLRWSAASAQREAREEADSRAVINAGLVASELQKYRLLPVVLAGSPEVEAALDTPKGAPISRLNGLLEQLAGQTDAAAIYLIDRNGLTVAASNWRASGTFVGQNYGFRPYFTGAMRLGAAEQFALGTISRRPGLFLAQRVAAGAGVIVVKVEFDRIERPWQQQEGPTVVRDANGVIIMTSRPQYRLLATRDLPGEVLRDVQLAKLYGATPLRELKWRLPPQAGIAHDGRGVEYVVSSAPVPIRGWSLSVLEPLAAAKTAATAIVVSAALAVSVIILVIGGIWVRIDERRRFLHEAQVRLEHEVEARTRELREANEQLLVESAERLRNEARLRSAREELAQSNRLATLGQISAGVAHEINQPLAAIQTFAENCAPMIDRDNLVGVRQNAGQIVDLAKRIGSITRELRLFARREHGETHPVRLRDAVDGAMLLMGDRLREGGVDVQLPRASASFTALADRVRLEQILINLLQNAADAVEGVAEPRIAITTAAEDDAILLRVSDNGPGIPEALRHRLFTPFATSKSNGLGLGLVIARDIAREFGGDLLHADDVPGATFIIRLKRA